MVTNWLYIPFPTATFLVAAILVIILWVALNVSIIKSAYNGTTASYDVFKARGYSGSFVRFLFTRDYKPLRALAIFVLFAAVAAIFFLLYVFTTF